MRRSGRTTAPGQEEQGMPISHDDLLTPTELEAAQLMVTLAWRLDGGQLVSADQLLARLCSIPTNDVAMASIVLLREVAHSVAPVLQRPSIEILDLLRSWLAGQAGRPANAAQSRDPSCRAVLPAFCPTALHRAARTRTTLNSQSSWTLLTRANTTQANHAGRIWMCGTRLK